MTGYLVGLVLERAWGSCGEITMEGIMVMSEFDMERIMKNHLSFESKNITTLLFTKNRENENFSNRIILIIQVFCRINTYGRRNSPDNDMFIYIYIMLLKSDNIYNSSNETKTRGMKNVGTIQKKKKKEWLNLSSYCKTANNNFL